MLHFQERFKKKPWAWGTFGLIGAVIFTNLVSRFLIGVVVSDQSDLVVYAQTLNWAYDEQVPAYYWILTFLLRATNYFILIPDLVKYAGLITCLWGVYAIASDSAGASRAGFLAVMAAFLIPTINDDMLREYTHTTSLMGFVAASFVVLSRSMYAKSNLMTAWPYLAALWAGGMLSKHSMFFIIAGQIVAYIRIAKPDRASIIALIKAASATLIVMLPIYGAMFLHAATVRTGISEFITASNGGRLRGLIDLLSSLPTESGLLALGAGGAYWALRRSGQRLSLAEKWLLWSVVWSVLFLAGTLLLAGFSVVRDRWFAPCVLMLVPLLAIWVHKSAQARIFLYISSVLALLVLIVGSMRAIEPLVDGWSNKPGRKNLPLIAIADTLQDTKKPYDAVLSGNSHIAATLKTRMPAVKIYTPATRQNIPATADTLMLIHSQRDYLPVTLAPAIWHCTPKSEHTAPLRYMKASSLFSYALQVCHRDISSEGRPKDISWGNIQKIVAL